MKKFGKTLSALVLLLGLALTLGLVGCNGKTDDSGKTDGPGDDTAVTYSVTLTKKFEAEMGTASLSAPASGDKYAKDELVTLTVTVNDGYTVESVTVGSEEVQLEEGKYSFKVRSDTQVTVALRAIAYYSVTAKGFTEEEGSVTFAPAANADGKYREGTNVTFTVKPGKRYAVKSVKVDGAEVELTEENSYSFVPAKDTEVEVAFEERTEFNVTVELDDKMCDVTYIGEDGENTSLKPGAIFAADKEVAFTVMLSSSYRLVSVTVNGEEVALEGNGFKVVVDEDLVIVVECVWDVKELDSLAGEYDLDDDVWYTFTLSESAAFDFTASNYVAYAAFYKVETVAEPNPGVDGKDGDLPVWIFNADDRTNQDAHAFEAGLYVARFTSNTGDGVGSSKLVISAVTLLDFELPESYNNSWKSTDVVEDESDANDHIYSMFIGNGCFALKKKDSEGVYHVVDATVTVQEFEDNPEYNEYHVTVDGKNYQLMPAYYGMLTGTLSLYDLEAEEEEVQIVFLPDPLPDIKPPKELVGSYAGVNYEDDTAVADLFISSSGITWDGKKMTLLSEISLGVDTNPSAGYPAVLYEGKLYAISAMEHEDHHQIMLTDAETHEMFSFKPKEGPAIDAKFQGTWKCQVETAALYGYTLEITADNIVVKDASGQVVEAIVSTTMRYTTEYVSFTIDGKTYLLQSVRPGLNNTSTLTVLSLSDNKSFNFVKQ